MVQLHFTDEHKLVLLKIARQSIEQYLESRSFYVRDDVDELLKQKRGVFTTLIKHGSLRGCIGYVVPVKPLYKLIAESAVGAAFFDPRFPPLTKHELHDIEIELSILTKPKEVAFSSLDDLMNKIEQSVGVIVEYKGKSATYLPEVWNYFNDKLEFFYNLCLKAGFDLSLLEHAKVYTYRTFKILEKDFNKNRKAFKHNP